MKLTDIRRSHNVLLDVALIGGCGGRLLTPARSHMTAKEGAAPGQENDPISTGKKSVVSNDSTAEPAANGSLVDAAIDYARMGWKILPCWWRPFGKIKPKSPIAELVPNGKDSATCDENLIHYWWKIRPQAMIGGVVPEGKQVLDLDHRAAEIDLNLWLTDTLGVKPDDTLLCHSGNSDGGYHLYSEAHAGRINPKRIPLGVDLRDAGKNYCILPPSIHPATGQPYRWNIPEGEKPLDYITDVLGPVWSFLTEADPPGVWTPGRNGKATRGQLEGILRRMARERTKRNIILNWAAYTIGKQGHPEGAYGALFKAAQASGLPDWEITKTINSARNAHGEKQS